MGSSASIVCHVVSFHVLLNSQSGLAAPGRPKAPVGRPVWTGEESGDISSGLLPYLMVFVVFPISLMLICICAKYSIKWCSRKINARNERLRSRNHANQQQHPHGPLTTANGNIHSAATMPRSRPDSDLVVDNAVTRARGIRTISSGRHSYSDLRSLSGFFSFRPNTLLATSTPGSHIHFTGSVGNITGRRMYEDDPPPTYPVEEPPPSYDSLFEVKKKQQQQLQQEQQYLKEIKV